MSNTHGGSRPGSGRKKGTKIKNHGRNETTSFRCSAEFLAFIREVGGKEIETQMRRGKMFREWKKSR